MVAGTSWRLSPFSCRRSQARLPFSEIVLHAHGCDGAHAKVQTMTPMNPVPETFVFF